MRLNSIISPVTQTLFSNNFQQTSTSSKEIAHPFRVEANSIVCSFIEFGEPSQSALVKIQKACSKFEQLISEQSLKSSFQDTFNTLSKEPTFFESKHEIMQEFYWNLGTYSVDITIEYDNNKRENFSYRFEIKEHEFEKLKDDVDEILAMALKDIYKEKFQLQAPTVTLTDKTNPE